MNSSATPTIAPDSKPLAMLAVVVLYDTHASQSQTLTDLRALHHAGVPLPARLMVIDNGGAPLSTDSVEVAELSAEYIRTSKNIGVAGAYELGRLSAHLEQIPYLLLLDQDSRLNADFFGELAMLLDQFNRDPDLAALMPRVLSGQRQVSPMTPLFGWRKKPILEDGPTQPGQMFRAINSGLILRRSFVDQLGGFEQRYWLDGLDHWLCFRMRELNMRAWCMHSHIEHNLSVTDARQYVSLERYRNILRSEALLYRDSFRPKERGIYLCALLFRAAMYPVRWRTWVYSWPSFQQFLKLCFRLM